MNLADTFAQHDADDAARDAALTEATAINSQLNTDVANLTRTVADRDATIADLRARIVDLETQVPTPEPVEEFVPLMGVYLGNHSENPDTKYHDNLGTYPDMSTQYYQADQKPGGPSTPRPRTPSSPAGSSPT